MGQFKSSRSVAQEAAHQAAASSSRGHRRSRAEEAICIVTLQKKLETSEGRVASLRRQVNEQKEEEGRLKSAYAMMEEKLRGSYAKKFERARADKRKLNEMLRAQRLPEEPSSGDDDPSSDDKEDEQHQPPKRKSRPKVGSYRVKETGVGSSQHDRSTQSNYQHRKAKEFERVIDNIFGKPLATDLSEDETHLRPCMTNSRGYCALKWVLHKLFSKHPNLWSDLLKEKKTVQQVEEAANAAIRKHWETQSLNIFTKCNFTQDGWQCLINLLSSSWDKDLEDFMRLRLPGGTFMCLMASMHSIIRNRERIAEELGISSTSDATTFDLYKALNKRLEYLDNEGLLTSTFDDPDVLVVQLLADASNIFQAKNTSGTAVVMKPVYDDNHLTEESSDLVNSRENMVLLCLYRKDDSYENMITHASTIRAQVNTLMEQGITVNGRHWRVRVPLGGDLKLLQALLGLCGGSSEFPCVYCKASTKQFWMSKAAWEDDESGGGLPLRSLTEQVAMAHTPGANRYRCPAPDCQKYVEPNDAKPNATSNKEMNAATRQREQRKHFGTVLGRDPYARIEPEDYVEDFLHMVLRSVPIIFRQTLSANCTKETMAKVAQWMYDHCDIIISDEVALQTDTGTKKLKMSAESWPGKTCRKLLDNFDYILKEAMPLWASSQQTLYTRCYNVWHKFYFLTGLVSDGCGPDPDSREAHAQALDKAGAEYLVAFIAVASREACKSPYLHSAACHLGDIVRKWGPLIPLCSQACESIHQWVKFFAKNRSNRKKWVVTVAKTMAVKQQVHQECGPGRRSQGTKRQRRGAGHLSKAEAEHHKRVKTEMMKQT